MKATPPLHFGRGGFKRPYSLKGKVCGKRLILSAVCMDDSDRAFRFTG